MKQRAMNKTDNENYEEMLNYEKGKELVAGVGNVVMKIETQFSDSEILKLGAEVADS